MKKEDLKIAEFLKELLRKEYPEKYFQDNEIIRINIQDFGTVSIGNEFSLNFSCSALQNINTGNYRIFFENCLGSNRKHFRPYYYEDSITWYWEYQPKSDPNRLNSFDKAMVVYKTFKILLDSILQLIKLID